MEISTDVMAEQVINSINKKIKNLNKLNIIVQGKSGAGKSTLINSIFREEIAKTGIGRPVTQEIRAIEKDSVPLKIYDTPGFELGAKQQEDVKNGIIELIESGNMSQDINKQIHCMLYCVNVGANRTFDDSEIEWLKKLTSESVSINVPIIIVLTQSVSEDNARKMKEDIEKLNLAVKKVVPVLAMDYKVDDNYIKKAYGLEELIEVMGEVLPEEIHKTFQNVQKVSLKGKRKLAMSAIATAVAGAIAAGAAPIPGSDASILVPVQIAMLTGITAAYGLHIEKATIVTVISTTIGAGGSTIIGKTVVSNILKFIPGIGTVAGGAISAGTAATITGALGKAYMEIVEKIYLGEIKQEELGSNSEKIKKEFEKNLKQG